jgi:hypothetical protein
MNVLEGLIFVGNSIVGPLSIKPILTMVFKLVKIKK